MDNRADEEIDGHGSIDSASDAEQEYVHFVRSDTPPAAICT